jgi:hypothetical protein
MRSEYVTGNYFQTFGINPFGGRLLTPGDDQPSSPPVAVLSHHIWQETYGSDPTVIGATFVVEGHPFTVIGVAPAGFFGETLRGDPPDLYIPLNQEPTLAAGSTSWSLGVGISIPIFDGFQRQATVDRARAQETTARAQLADAKLAVSSQLESALGTLQLDSSRIALDEEAVNASQEDLRVQQARYQAGASTMLDLLTSQQSLVKAQTDLVAARYDYQVARAQLEAIAGRDL